MRISSLQIFNIANSGMADANQAMVKTQEQLSTGKRVSTPSDDPVASTKIIQLTEELANINQYGINSDLAENSIVLQESALEAINNLIVRMQELAVQAGNNATLGPTEYKALAAEVDSRLEELQSLLNTKGPGGDYIFGGYRSTTEPFSGTASTGFSYNGDEGQKFVKIANNTHIAASDSGKKIFVDIPSAENTVRTYPSSNNRSSPPVEVSVGQVFDQEAYDEFYPEDIVISFNHESTVVPAGKNYTATERSTGKVIVANQPFRSGELIELKGVRFAVVGEPASGTAAQAALLNFDADGVDARPIDFTATPETFDITVRGRKETLVLDGPINSAADLSTVLNSAGNGNAAALARLGVAVDATGFNMPAGLQITLSNGSANTNAALGVTSATQSVSSGGVTAVAGDRIFIEATNKQDVLTTLAQMSESMKTYEGGTEDRRSIEKVIASTLKNLSNAQTSISNVTSELGARYNTIDSTRSLHLDSEVVINKFLADLRDVDYAEAATRLSVETLVLQAAQSSFVRVSQLTLFSQL
ncbi:flagellar hook-associated protein FlgL [Saccharophagus degradans]|uniref:Flagellin-like protein n=1 Tax=Saccharophagus degradans (strain 2-40 / ATCC 43961 / DSM 17024) TaxID=203122 RepID=Q21IL6_SACD2|nr:flagellar hook-associated protein FlgL [Saccharophagus degradans]ABD81463.1 flagellin-like protein [Saccharophagus degradans 2-40]